jgi:hypothetical protein
MSAVVEAPPEPIEAITETDSLEFVRELAACRDPRRVLLYSTASPARIKHSAAVAQRLIEVHRRYLRRSPRDRGRRRHNAEIYDLLAQTNDASLVLALAWLDAAFALLPPGTKE